MRLICAYLQVYSENQGAIGHIPFGGLSGAMVMWKQWNFDPNAVDRPRRSIGVSLGLPRFNPYCKYSGESSLKPTAILISDVSTKGTAWEAGLIPEDIVFEVDGIRVADLPGASEDLVEALIAYLQSCDGDKVRFGYIRGSIQLETEVYLSEQYD